MTVPPSSPAGDATPQAVTHAAVLALIRASLALWGVDAAVSVGAGGLIGIVHSSATMGIDRAPAALPFRWLVTIGARQRAASSATGLLRVIRSELDPSWRPGRVRIAALTPPAGRSAS